ncbi:50S ribosomal protein L15e [Candidatus Woesearchaeota archaeon]|nr:50S ribosomal protein L15e [Candidatus Woesearchaeota archaeon]
MGLYQYVREVWKKPKQNISELMRERLIQWRREEVTVKIQRPTRIDRARSLGYKAKQGIIMVRQRVPVSTRKREGGIKGRRPKTQRRKKVVSKNYKQIAEERAAKKYTNLEVLNSYWVGEDGQQKWFEIIMIDKEHPAIKKDKDLNWIGLPQQRRRVFRGLTSAAKKSRGLRKKGKGAEKIRPSQRANLRKAH